MSVNKVILVGRLGSDPEVRNTNSGKAVANFSLATDESYKDRDGNKVKKVEWHKLQLWDKLAEIAEKYLHKGDMIYVEGSIATRQYEDPRDGAKHSVTEIKVFTLKMLQTTGNSEQPATPAQRQAPAPARRAAPPAGRTAQRPAPAARQQTAEPDGYDENDPGF